MQAPPVTVPVSTPAHRNTLKLDRSFVFSIIGLLNAALIIALLGGIISIGVVQNATYSGYQRTATESAYLVFACVGLVLEILLFILQSFGITSFTWFKCIPFIFVYAVKDLIFGISLFGIGISCAVMQSSQYWANYANPGSFGAAAFFAFLCTLIYLVHFVLCVMELMRMRNRSH